MSYLVAENIPSMDGSLVNGIVRFKDVNFKLTKKNTIMGDGTLVDYKGDTIPYIVWEEATARQIEEELKKKGKYVCNITAKVNVYLGNVSLIPLTFERVEDPELAKPFLVLSNKDNEYRKAFFDRFKSVLEGNLSEEGYSTFRNFFKKDELLTPFSIEYAGKKIHDARPSGLIHHTSKMLELAILTLKQQEFFNLNQRGIDLLLLGLAIHDIGKVRELEEGSYTSIGKATHRGLGIEMLVDRKDIILESYDEDFFYELLAIINQHHGKYEEKPHTIFSYLVHIIDNYESDMTFVHDSIKRAQSTGTLKPLDPDYYPLEVTQCYFKEKEQ